MWSSSRCVWFFSCCCFRFSSNRCWCIVRIARFKAKISSRACKNQFRLRTSSALRGSSDSLDMVCFNEDWDAPLDKDDDDETGIQWIRNKKLKLAYHFQVFSSDSNLIRSSYMNVEAATKWCLFSWWSLSSNRKRDSLQRRIYSGHRWIQWRILCMNVFLSTLSHGATCNL